MNDSVAIKNPNPGQAALRESFVLVAMSVVAVAVGVGLYAQFEAGFLSLAHTSTDLAQTAEVAVRALAA